MVGTVKRDGKGFIELFRLKVLYLLRLNKVTHPCLIEFILLMDGTNIIGRREKWKRVRHTHARREKVRALMYV